MGKVISDEQFDVIFGFTANEEHAAVMKI